MQPFVIKHRTPEQGASQKIHPATSIPQRTTIPFAVESLDSVGGNYVYGVRRIVYIALAGIFFALGILGIPVPGLPTTPFLLLSSFFLARSWPRMHRSLLKNRIVGPVLRQWQEHRAVDPKVKLRASVLVVVSLVLLISYSNLSPALLALVLTFAVMGQYVIYRLPTRKCPKVKPSDESLQATRLASAPSAGHQMSS